MSWRGFPTAKIGTSLFGCLIAMMLSLVSIPVKAADTRPTSVEVLILHAETLRKQGFLRDAEEQLQQALTTQPSPDAKTRTLISALLGNVYLQWRRTEQAKHWLEQSFITAKQQSWPLLAAMAANYLGNLHFQRLQFDLAGDYYQQSLNWADKAGDPAVTTQTQLNQARLASRRQRLAQAKELLTQLTPVLSRISGRERTDLSLQAAEQWLTLISAGDTEATRPAYQLLTRARQTAQHEKDKRAQSLATGYLARLYEYTQRHREALRLTDQAVTLAQQEESHDLLLQWEHQRARLFKALNRAESAIDAYRRAIAHIEAIRQDIPVFYQHGRSSFRETLEPVYLGLADLLLQKSRNGETNTQLLLREVRQTVELIKKTELEDYFHGRCALPDIGLDTKKTLSPRTATLYPIVLADRLELLVNIGATIYQQSVKLPASTLIEDAKLLATQLRRRRSRFREPSQRLYAALIAPLLPLLEDNQVETITIIADRELRLIPFAALYDGQQYLIERYRLLYSPGLVTRPDIDAKRDPIKALLAGVSHPGPAIKTLPQAQLQSLLPYVLKLTDRAQPEAAPANARSSLVRSITLNNDARMSTAEIQALLNQPGILQKAQQLLALPGVDQEIDRLDQLLPATTLLDQGFVSERLQQEIRRTPYNIIHIASHGYFGHSSEQSYIMAYDRILTMDHLEQLLNQTNNKRSPIELLTLSACQTAEGDDRSPLGLSGIALKAQVRSVLGSLWPVSDAATVQLMQAFYRHLSTAPANKALALQKAQLELLNKPKRAHPFYWSPFILIGDHTRSGFSDD